MAGASAPALGLLSLLALRIECRSAISTVLFWGVATVINILVGGLVVVMAYAVAFFGVSWPDRVIKSRLFKWILRGPSHRLGGTGFDDRGATRRSLDGR